MLKRCQVLLTDWMIEDIKIMSERYDISFPELVRMAVAIVSTGCIAERYPKTKFGVTCKELVGVLQKVDKAEMGEELHKLISKIYFEARKAIEFSRKQEKKKTTLSRPRFP